MNTEEDIRINDEYIGIYDIFHYILMGTGYELDTTAFLHNFCLTIFINIDIENITEEDIDCYTFRCVRASP